MSEQRFTYDKPIVAFSKGGINDNATGKTYEFTMDTVLDLLNGQQATIKKLQDLCGKSDGENMKLRIENEQLRQSVEYWQKKYEEGTETFQIN